MFLKHAVFVFVLSLSFKAFAAPERRFQILEEHAHDPSVFTQGLAIDGNDFIESSGLYGRSFVRRYPLPSAPNVQAIEQSLPRHFFAEGLSVVGSYVYLLSWREHTLLVLDKASLKPRYKKNYTGEGWGLTFDGSHLIMSNGTSELVYRDKSTFEIKRLLAVHDRGSEVNALNELEYAWGSIWANVWQSDKIVQIDPLSGMVLSELRLTELVQKNGNNSRNVLNGIAYDPQKDALWVTGKNWPNKYLLKIEK